jgi:hypothetical protein
VRRDLLDIFGHGAALGVSYRCDGGEVGMAHGPEAVDAPQTELELVRTTSETLEGIVN